MSHYDEYREEEYFLRREKERKRVAAKGKMLLDGLDAFRGAGASNQVHLKEEELRAAVIHWMYSVGSLKLNGE